MENTLLLFIFEIQCFHSNWQGVIFSIVKQYSNSWLEEHISCNVVTYTPNRFSSHFKNIKAFFVIKIWSCGIQKNSKTGLGSKPDDKKDNYTAHVSVTLEKNAEYFLFLRVLAIFFAVTDLTFFGYKQQDGTGTV